MCLGYDVGVKGSACHPHRLLLTTLLLAISLCGTGCDAYWIEQPTPTVPSATRVVRTATLLAPPTTTPVPTLAALPQETETPANRLDLVANSVQYWSNPNSIHDVVMNGGTLWAATYGGLVAWTPSGDYHIYGMQDGLPSQAVQALAVDNLGRLWLSYADVDGYTVRLDGGWVHYASRREAVSTEYSALLNSKRIHPRMWVNRPESGWLWQPRLDGRVEAYDGTRWRVYGTDNGLTPNNRFVGISSAGRVWAVGDGIAYAQEGELWWQDHTFFSEIETSEDVTDIAVDAEGTLWMTFAGQERGGLIRFDPVDQRWEGHLPDINPAIPSRSHGLEILADGTLWVTGRDMLSYHVPQRRFQALGLDGVTVLCFARDDEGLLWMGSQTGLWRLDLESESLEGPWEVPSPLPDNRITGLAVDTSGAVFVATPRGVSWIDDEGVTELATDAAVAWLGVDAAGQVWAATSEGLQPIDRAGLGATLLEISNVASAAFGADGCVRLLTTDGKLLLYDGQAIQEQSDILTETGSLPRAVVVDPLGGTWVATAAGLLHLEPDGAQTLFTRDNGLLSDDVRGLSLDGDGNVWVATASGLARHRPDGRWTRFTVESTGGGLRDMDMRDLSVGPSGDLWMATRAGLSRRQPAEADWSYVDLPGAEHVLHDGNNSLWVSTGAGLYRVPVSVLTAVQE